LAFIFGALMEKRALLLLFLYFKASADKLVNLIWDEQVTFAELSINVIVWISIPNEAYDLKENLTVPPKSGII
jgi:hypothetical protein